jgi:hypothetical protein
MELAERLRVGLRRPRIRTTCPITRGKGRELACRVGGLRNHELGSIARLHENGLMTRRVTWSRDELDVGREAVAPADLAVLRALEMNPPLHRVVSRERRFVFCLLDEDRNAAKQSIVPAVIEVQMGVDDGGKLPGRQPEMAQRVEKVRSARPVQLLDQRAPFPDTCVDEEARFTVANQEGEDLARSRTLGMRLRQLELGN